MNIQKRYVALAVCGALGASSYVAYAETFNAGASLVNTLAITVDNDFDIGGVFATATGTQVTDGVAAIVIDADGTVTPNANSAVSLTSISAPTPAQGTVAVNSDFTLIPPNTSGITTAQFADQTAISIIDPVNNAVELAHDSGNTAVPSLYLMHFTVGALTGGTVQPAAGGTANDGVHSVTLDFAAAEFSFAIGGTVTTEPLTGAAAYQEGTYSGSFEVTAEY